MTHVFYDVFARHPSRSFSSHALLMSPPTHLHHGHKNTEKVKQKKNGEKRIYRKKNVVRCFYMFFGLLCWMFFFFGGLRNYR